MTPQQSTYSIRSDIVEDKFLLSSNIAKKQILTNIFSQKSEHLYISWFGATVLVAFSDVSEGSPIILMMWYIAVTLCIGLHCLVNKTIHRMPIRSRAKSHLLNTEITWLTLHSICVSGLAVAWGGYISIVLSPHYEFNSSVSLILVTCIIFHNIMSYSSSTVTNAVYGLSIIISIIIFGFFLGVVDNIPTLSYLFLSALVCIFLTRSFKNINYGFENIKSQFRDTKRELGQIKLENTQKSQNFEILEYSLTELQQNLTYEKKAHKDTQLCLLQSKEQLSFIIDSVDVVFWDWDLSTHEILQSKSQEFLGLNIYQSKTKIEHLLKWVHPDDMGMAKTELARHVKGKSEQLNLQFRVRGDAQALMKGVSDGNNGRSDDHEPSVWLWYDVTGRAVKWDSQGKVCRMLGIWRNVTQEKRRAIEARFVNNVFDNLKEGIFILDSNYHFIAANDAFCQITGYCKEEVYGIKLGDPRFWRGKGGENTLNKYYSIIENLKQKDFWQGELLERKKTGEYYPQSIRVSTVRDELGHISHYIGVFSDLTGHRYTQKRLEYLHNYDKLTGLSNRKLFNGYLEEQVRKAQIFKNELALLYLDIDDFKYINDCWDIEMGDSILRQVAGRLRRLVAKKERIGRLAGNEFGIIFNHFTKPDEVVHFARKIIAAISKPFNIDGKDVIISVSIGVSLFPETAEDASALRNQATLALNYIKRQGGNQYQFFEPSFNQKSSDVNQATAEHQLRCALNNNELVVFYQPIMDVKSKTIKKLEALVRWQHPDKGLVTPDQFIPLAEKTGLVLAIDEWVLNNSCQQLKRWHLSGFNDVKLSVNMSAHQFHRKGLLKRVENVLQNHGLASNYLNLELTESVLMDDVQSAISVLHDLRQLNVQISLDDFGTGYSSLAYLAHFPVDVLKIDKSFIRKLSDKHNAAITKTIISMAHNLDMKVIAEGVEAKEHVEFLESHHCDMIQGYYIGKPVPALDIGALLARQKQVVIEEAH